ncbi:MAG: hypothetical protein PHS32_21865 [Rhodoferax sp.]|uniref:TA system antitoxin ParD family protein n=1 Tax=Rhodoferax sp. TaxID=50421 RepID=UPI002611075F|nr:hypothetical protein [Rhodoferax sp.]MDD5336395.1 hypothetical protein [Rhodoferax sp.]
MKMSKNVVARKKYVQISLSPEFAESLRADAEVSDRSMSAQLEHWARIAKAIETVAPANFIPRVKAAKEPSEILSALAAFVAAPNVDAMRSQYVSSGVVNYGIDPAQPKVVIAYHPDGKVVRGSFDAGGDFVPNQQPATERTGRVSQEKLKPASSRSRAGIATKKGRAVAAELAHAG